MSRYLQTFLIGPCVSPDYTLFLHLNILPTRPLVTTSFFVPCCHCRCMPPPNFVVIDVVALSVVLFVVVVVVVLVVVVDVLRRKTPFCLFITTPIRPIHNIFPKQLNLGRLQLFQSHN